MMVVWQIVDIAGERGDAGRIIKRRNTRLYPLFVHEHAHSRGLLPLDVKCKANAY